MPDYSKDYYRILQVHPTAEPEVVQAAYRRLARKYHPDLEQGDGRRMQEINEAYQVLCDEESRQAYDRWRRLSAWRRPASTPAPPEAAPEGPPGFSAWKVIISTTLALAILSVLALDMFRLGIRGLPEITLLLVVLGLLVYFFGGIRDLLD